MNMKYEAKGNRVRYLSAQRNEWEALPESLVDWPATEKYEKDRVAGASVPKAVQLDKELEQDRDREEAQLPQVAPGLRLPEDSGVFLLDSFQGEPQIVEIQQTAGDVNRNTKANIFRGAINPVAGLKQVIELEAPTPLCSLASMFLRSTSTWTPPPTTPIRPPRKVPPAPHQVPNNLSSRNNRSRPSCPLTVSTSYAPRSKAANASWAT